MQNPGGPDPDSNPLEVRANSRVPAKSAPHRAKFGWIDWCDTGQVWPDWEKPDFNDSGWQLPVETNPGIGPVTEAQMAPVRLNELPIQTIAQGELTQNYGYELDDPAVRFFLADLAPRNVPPQGVWRRYDLGRVRLGRADFTLDAPKGATVEFALCEQLRHGRVHPWITLSTSASCNLDHFVARGGPEEFMPFSPKGGRFLEVHVISSAPVKFLKEAFLERTYYDEPIGSFQCHDPLLTKIWATGIATTRACADDALVDCPSRERGEWTGDTATVATDNCAAAFSDLGLSRKALVQAAQSARADGLVAGVEPGQPQYVSTYAALWVSACVHYWELSGDKTLLTELLPSAERNIGALQSKMTPEGLEGDLGWEFIDWGYVPNAGPSDMALNIEYFMALRAMERWHNALGLDDKSKQDAAWAAADLAVVRVWLRTETQRPGGWSNVGYHRASLALLAGLVDPADLKACIKSIEGHLLACFPNEEDAPRLSDPSVSNNRLMTPYFCHFALAALLDHGETEFVLDQYRKCWGWALAQGWTTWPEVFDARWSLCHEWSGCPSWQLTRYILGFKSRFDLGENVYDVNIHSGDLRSASGDIPMPSGQKFHVEWAATQSNIRLTVTTPTPIILNLGAGQFKVSSQYQALLPRHG